MFRRALRIMVRSSRVVGTCGDIGMVQMRSHGGTVWKVGGTRMECNQNSLPELDPVLQRIDNRCPQELLTIRGAPSDEQVRTLDTKQNLFRKGGNLAHSDPLNGQNTRLLPALNHPSPQTRLEGCSGAMDEATALGSTFLR